MSYAIGYIVYGLDLTASSYSSNPPAYDALKDIKDADGEFILSDLFENGGEERGFDSCYSGGGDQPQWFGVTTGNIDECNTVDGNNLIKKLTVSEETAQKYQDLLDGLEAAITSEEDKKFFETLKSFEPKVMILWGSS